MELQGETHVEGIRWLAQEQLTLPQEGGGVPLAAEASDEERVRPHRVEPQKKVDGGGKEPAGG